MYRTEHDAAHSSGRMGRKVQSAVGARDVKRESHLVQNPVDGGHVDVADVRDAACAVWRAVLFPDARSIDHCFGVHVCKGRTRSGRACKVRNRAFAKLQRDVILQGPSRLGEIPWRYPLSVRQHTIGLYLPSSVPPSRRLLPIEMPNNKNNVAPR